MTLGWPFPDAAQLLAFRTINRLVLHAVAFQFVGSGVASWTSKRPSRLWLCSLRQKLRDVISVWQWIEKSGSWTVAPWAEKYEGHASLTFPSISMSSRGGRGLTFVGAGVTYITYGHIMGTYEISEVRPLHVAIDRNSLRASHESYDANPQHSLNVEIWKSLLALY